MKGKKWKAQRTWVSYFFSVLLNQPCPSVKFKKKKKKRQKMADQEAVDTPLYSLERGV